MSHQIKISVKVYKNMKENIKKVIFDSNLKQLENKREQQKGNYVGDTQ